jgi:hypothetical protein
LKTSTMTWRQCNPLRFRYSVSATVVLGILLAMMPAGPVLADTLEVPVDARVYAEANKSSKVLTVIRKGTTVPVSPKNYDRYRKVLIKQGSSKIIGFVSLDELRGASIKPLGAHARARREATRGLPGKKAFGLSPGLNYQYQGGQTYVDPQGASDTIGVLSGMSYQVEAFFEYPLTKRMTLRGYLQYKSVSVTGSAQINAPNSVPNAPSDTYLKETFIVGGGLLKIYPGRAWWWGGGAQVDKGITGSLKFGSYNAIPLTGSDLPTFVKVYGAIGVDFALGKNFYLTPDIRLGVLANATPIVYEGNFHLGITKAL